MERYVSKIKHTDLKEIAKTIAVKFSVQTEYFLGIKRPEIFQTRNPNLAALYIVKGKKLPIEEYFKEHKNVEKTDYHSNSVYGDGIR